MKKKIKMIALDLDGTTFTNDKRITQHTKDVIQTAIAQGIIVLPSTGRQFSGLPEEFLSIPGVSYAITSNGAAVVDTATEKPIYTNYIPYELAASEMEKLLQEDVLVDIYANGVCYIEQSMTARYEDFLTSQIQMDYFHKTRIPVKNLPEFIRNNRMDSEKFHILFHDDTPMNQLRKKYKKDSRFLATFALSNNLELNSPTADKGTALLALADHLGIPHEQTMACGDSFNDEAMLRKAGFSVAMGNAVAEMKEICDVITKTNEEDGVAYAIETYVLDF